MSQTSQMNAVPCCVYCMLLLACSAELASVLISLNDGILSYNFNFLELLMLTLVGAVVLGAFELKYLWYVVLIFGFWSAYFPPRKVWTYLAFSLMATLAGVWASYCFEAHREPGILNDPEYVQMPAELKLNFTIGACVDALVSTVFCLLVVRRLFRKVVSSERFIEP